MSGTCLFKQQQQPVCHFCLSESLSHSGDAASGIHANLAAITEIRNNILAVDSKKYVATVVFIMRNRPRNVA